MERRTVIISSLFVVFFISAALLHRNFGTEEVSWIIVTNRTNPKFTVVSKNESKTASKNITSKDLISANRTNDIVATKSDAIAPPTTASTEADVTTTKSTGSRSNLTLDDIAITIKSTKKFHISRIKLLLRTWMKMALNQVRIVENLQYVSDDGAFAYATGDLRQLDKNYNVSECSM